MVEIKVLLFIAPLILFFLGTRYILYGFVVSACLHAIVIADIGVTRLSLHQWAGLLFIARYALRGLRTKRLKINTSKTYLFALLFLFTCVFSWVATIHYAGDIEVYRQTVGTWSEKVNMRKPLQFTMTNITQFIFPLYGITLFYCIGNYIRKIAKVGKIINSIVWVGLLVGVNHIIYGIFQYVGYGFVIQDYTSYLIGEVGFSSPVSGGLVSFMRPYTLLGEPSDTAVFYVVCISLLIGLILLGGNKREIVSNGIYKILFLLVLVFLNGSTSGYLGLGILLGVVFLFYLYQNIFTRYRLRTGGVVLLLVLICSGYLLIFSGVIGTEYTLEYHLRKVSLAERTARAVALVHTLKNVFMVSPIFGAGYGSHLSPVFLAYLIGNVGIVGFLCFYLMVGSVIYTVHGYDTGVLSKETRATSVSVLFAVTVFFATTAGAASGAVMGWGMTWLILGLGASFGNLENGQAIGQTARRQRIAADAV